MSTQPEIQSSKPAHATINADEHTADDVCELLRPIRNRLDELSSFATKTHSGSGGWWELSGYAEILDDAMKRVRSHRARVENVDRQIAREKAESR